MIASGTFDPEVVEAMTTAYEMALSDLDLILDRTQPIPAFKQEFGVRHKRITESKDTSRCNDELMRQRGTFNAVGQLVIDSNQC